jgi:ribokinase
VSIAVVGSYGTGMTMRVDRMPDAGQTLSGGLFSAGPGGKGSNQAIGAARLGESVHLLTAVGDDSFARSGRELWAAEGVDASHVVTVDAATMVGVILVEPTGENRIVIAPGALERLSPDHVAGFGEVIGAADLVMVCNEIPQATVEATLRTAARHRIPTLFNPAPARDIADSVTGLVGYLTPNRGEAELLTGAAAGTSPDDLLDRLRSRFPAAVIALTCGADGVVVDGHGTRATIPAVAVPAVVDTTGAGDAFNAAFAVGICRGWSPLMAARFGAAAGAFAVGRPEVIPGLGHPDDLAPLAGPPPDRREHAEPPPKE